MRWQYSRSRGQRSQAMIASRAKRSAADSALERSAVSLSAELDGRVRQRCYQTRHALARTIGASGLHENAFWNSGMFDTTPFTR